jgi:hypothetical protein
MARPGLVQRHAIRTTDLNRAYELGHRTAAMTCGREIGILKFRSRKDPPERRCEKCAETVRSDQHPYGAGPGFN